MFREFENAGDETPWAMYTEVLFRCERCPKLKVDRLTGHWKLEQLILGEEMARSPVETKVVR